MTAERDLARAVNKTARKHAGRARGVHRAVVTALHPLTVSVIGLGLELDDDDFEMSTAMAAWDSKYDLAVDDAVLMLHDGAWLMIDVLDHKKKDRIATHVVKDGGDLPAKYKAKLPAYDVNGKLIGHIPVI